MLRGGETGQRGGADGEGGSAALITGVVPRLDLNPGSANTVVTMIYTEIERHYGSMLVRGLLVGCLYAAPASDQGQR